MNSAKATVNNAFIIDCEQMWLFKDVQYVFYEKTLLQRGRFFWCCIQRQPSQVVTYERLANTSISKQTKP